MAKDCQKCDEHIRTIEVMDGALHLACDLAVAIKPLIPKPESLTPEQRVLWQRVVNVIFKSADYADLHQLGQWTGIKKPETIN